MTREENFMLVPHDRTIPSRREKRLHEEEEQAMELIRFALRVGNATEAARRENE